MFVIANNWRGSSKAEVHLQFLNIFAIGILVDNNIDEEMLANRSYNRSKSFL
jgi:hypothetical protein